MLPARHLINILLAVAIGAVIAMMMKSGGAVDAKKILERLHYE